MTANWYSAPAPVARRVRAYFAPVNRATQTPVLFDPSQFAAAGRFNLDTPPAPWVNLGWIQEFARMPAGQSAPLLTGIPAAPPEQVRETLAAEVSLQFLSWTKLTMALATNSQHMNVLVAANGAAPAPLGAQAATAAAIQSGSTATSILLAPGDAAQFSAGSAIAVDVDYTGQTGFVGSPVSGAYVRQPLADVDYIRRVTFNVALVSQASSTGLTLASPLIGGAPQVGAKVQAVTGFVDREGGCFYQEWSALFALEGSQGERIYYYYPRLQPIAGAEEVFVPLDASASRSLSGGFHQVSRTATSASRKASASAGISTGIGAAISGSQETMKANVQSRVQLIGHFLALPVSDPLDGERVVCYRSFLPAPNALI
jgi:hypothetical protein